MWKTCPGFNAAAAALAIGAGLILPAMAQAAEAILFDGNNCSGQYRMTDRSISDFDQIGFDNKVNSLMVITGAFRFYRDANYGEGNGPSFQLGPSGYTETCWSLQDASQGSFPNDRMSAIQLLQDSAGPQPTGIAIVYDFTNFGGRYRILTRDVSDFNAIGFDNDVESIRVISGTWTFFRNANYGAPPNRPSVTLGPGDYPSIANLPGYPNGTFPGDLMSSAQVAAGNAPPPPPPPPQQQCGPGQIAGNTQCHNCWDQFGNDPGSSLPSADGSQCACAPGYEWFNFTAANIDGVVFRDCRPAQPACGPGQIAGNAQCHDCWEPFGNEPGSSQPSADGSQCACAPGYEWFNFTAANIDGVVFRDCRSVQQPQPDQVCPGPYHVATADGRCVWSCGAGTQPAANGECMCQPGLVQIGTDQFGRRVCGQ